MPAFIEFLDLTQPYVHAYDWEDCDCDGFALLQLFIHFIHPPDAFDKSFVGLERVRVPVAAWRESLLLVCTLKALVLPSCLCKMACGLASCNLALKRQLC